MTSIDKSEWKEVRAVTPARSKPASDYKIPLLIHQSHKSRHLPVRMADNIQKWIDMNPEFEHRYYDDEAMLAYVVKHGSERFKSAFHKIEALWGRSCRAFQADLFRYLLLHKEGGVWVDADMVVSEPLLESMQPHDQYVTMFTWEKSVSQWLIKTMPAHPFITTCLSDAVDAILGITRKLVGRHHMLYAVGASRLYNSIQQLVTLKERHEVPYEATFEFEGKNFQYRVATDIGFAAGTYAGYREDLELLGARHWYVPARLSSKIYQRAIPLLSKLLWLKSIKRLVNL